MRFASPLYLLLLIPLAALLWLELRKKTAAIRFPDITFFGSYPNRGMVYKYIALFLNLSTLLFMILALARPQRGRVYEETETKGVDIMLCMDVSNSMGTTDITPSRIGAAKSCAKELISGRPGDRFGLVIFANGSLVQCPLTADQAMLGAIFDRLDVGTIDPTTTAIGMGLASAVARVKDSKAKNKIIILLTDGANHTGEIDPLTAAKLAQSYGIKVYCIGVGTKGGTIMVQTIFGPMRQPVQDELDMNTLDQIAAITGGQAFLATDAEGLKVIYDEISTMEPTTYKVTRHTVYSEKAQLFLIPAGFLFLLSLLFSAVIVRKLP